jgi:hypothetical protein
MCTSTLPNGITPYEALYGTKPDLSTLRVFGCRCFVLIPPELRKKGDVRRFEAIFLGYEADRKGWKVMGVDGRLTFSHDVVFDENTPGRLSSKRASVSALRDGLLDSTAVPEVRRSRRLRQLGPEDAGMDGVVLLAGDDEVEMDEDVERSADDRFALYVAADVARRGSLDGGIGELGGAVKSDGGAVERVVDDRDFTGGPLSAVDELEDELKAMLVDSGVDVSVSGGRVFMDEDGVVQRLDEGFMSYMCTVGHQRIFDDPDDLPSSGGYDGVFRNMDERVTDEWDDAMLLSVDLNKPPNSLKEAMARPDWPR